MSGLGKKLIESATPRMIHDRESYIHDKVLQDLIAAHLYVVNHVLDDEEVLELSFGEPNRDGVRPVRYKTIKNREVELIVHS